MSMLNCWAYLWYGILYTRLPPAHHLGIYQLPNNMIYLTASQWLQSAIVQKKILTDAGMGGLTPLSNLSEFNPFLAIERSSFISNQTNIQ